MSFMIQLNPRLRPSAKTINKISNNHMKAIIPQTRAKRLKSLTPFLERQHTETTMTKTPHSKLQNSRQSDKRYKKIQIVSHILRKSINACKNQTEDKDKNPANLKDTTHFYKRVITYNPDK